MQITKPFHMYDQLSKFYCLKWLLGGVYFISNIIFKMYSCKSFSYLKGENTNDYLTSASSKILQVQ